MQQSHQRRRRPAIAGIWAILFCLLALALISAGGKPRIQTGSAPELRHHAWHHALQAMVAELPEEQHEQWHALAQQSPALFMRVCAGPLTAVTAVSPAELIRPATQR